MDDWKQLFQFSQSVFIGIVFSFLIAKLISVVVSFREENLSIVRDDSTLNEPKLSSSELKPIGDDASASVAEENSRVSVEEQSVIEKANEAIGNSLVGDDDGFDSDDDWEDVESTELDEAFSAATVLWPLLRLTSYRRRCRMMCNCSFMGSIRLPPRDCAVRRSLWPSK